MDTLRAGAAQVDITPHLRSPMQGIFHKKLATDVHDPLRAKAIVLDDGDVTLAVVGCDLIAITRKEVAAVRRIVAERCGIKPQHVMVACTHTHSGPWMVGPHGDHSGRNEGYLGWLVPRIADAVDLAFRKLQPARLSSGVGFEDSVSFNRRYWLTDGTVKMNPGKGNPDVERPAGPIDPELFVLYVESHAGSPIACLTTFSLHYVGTDSPTAFSADYFGHFADSFAGTKGADCITILLNGASGDINHVDIHDSRQGKGHAEGRRVADILASEAVKVISKASPVDTCLLGGAVRPIAFKRKTITPGDVEVANRIISGDDPGETPRPGPFSWVSGMALPKARWEHYARESLRLSDLPLQLTTEVQVLRVGRHALVALPGEAFVEIGLNIKEVSPSDQTAVIGLANDYIGYCPTDRALQEGSYETWAATTAIPAVGIEGAFVSACAAIFPELF